jgi:hypothetical protein
MYFLTEKYIKIHHSIATAAEGFFLWKKNSMYRLYSIQIKKGKIILWNNVGMSIYFYVFSLYFNVFSV